MQHQTFGTSVGMVSGLLNNATSGHRDCVLYDTGALVPVDDARALADLLTSFNGRRDVLRGFGMTAREIALTNTHKSMHEVRAEMIRNLCR